MIDASVIREIISVYAKHGWTLRRVLLSTALETALANGLPALFAGAAIQRSEMDAIWVSRERKPDGTAWEIRHLSSAPFALVIVVDEKAGEFEDMLLDTEGRFRETVGKRIIGH